MELFNQNIKTMDIIWMAVTIIIMFALSYWAKGFRQKQQDIIAKRNYFFIGSGIAVAVCLIMLIYSFATGTVNYSLEFTGGTMLEVGFTDKTVDGEKLHAAIDAYNNSIVNAEDKLKRPIIQMESKEKTVDFPGKMQQFILTVKDERGDVFTAEQLKGISAPFVDKYGKAQILSVQPQDKDATLLTLAVDPESLAPADGTIPEASEPSEITVSDADPLVKAFNPSLTVTQVQPAGLIEPERKSENYRAAMIRITREDLNNLSNTQVTSLLTALGKTYGDVYKFKVESIGPSVGQELARKAILAVIISLILQLLYITIRFNRQFRYGLAADISLVHDLIIMIGIYCILGREIDSPFVAALLTIIGYSVMDSIIVFDRIRENLKLFRKETYEQVVNRSVNQSMTRSMNTLVTVLITLFALYFFGGATLQNFAFALILGCTIGTYSSIFLSAPIVVLIDEYAKKQEKGRIEERRAVLEEEAKSKSAGTRARKPRQEEEDDGGDEGEDAEEKDGESRKTVRVAKKKTVKRLKRK